MDREEEQLEYEHDLVERDIALAGRENRMDELINFNVAFKDVNAVLKEFVREAVAQNRSVVNLESLMR